MYVEHCNKNINVLFIVNAKIVDKLRSEIRIPNVCKSNSNSNVKTKVRKFELRLTCLYETIKNVISQEELQTVAGDALMV